MAWEFVDKPDAKLYIKSADSNDIYTVDGVHSTGITVAQAVEGVNYLLGVGGKAAVADENMRRTVYEGVVNNG